MSNENKSAADVAAEVKSHLDDKVKAIALEITGRMEAGDKVVTALKERADELLTAKNAAATELANLKARADEMEQKLDRAGGDDDTETKSYGEQFVESDQYKSFQSNNFQGSAKLSMKEITAAQSGAGAQSMRDNTITPLGRRNDVLVRDLLNVIPTTSGSIDYVRQNLRTNAAAPVAESAAKPYSAYTWEVVNAPVRVIAHLAKITRQALDDATQLQGEIDSEMRYGLRLAEESQLLNGSGVGANINGLITQATAYAAPFDPAGTETMIDQIGLAILQQSLTEFETDGIVMHPSDWMRIRLIKDADGNYILGDPGANLPQVLFGRPVVTTQAITIDKFLVGGFRRQKLYDRMAPEVLISSENANDFETNLFTMRCEQRIGLAIRQPTALVFGDFANIV